MNAVQKKDWDDLMYGIYTLAVQKASVAMARLIREMPEKTTDDVFERLMARGGDIFCEEMGEMIEGLVERLNSVVMAVEGNSENLSGFSPPAPDAAPILVARAG